MEEYKIEKGIPIPFRARADGSKYPFERMEVGDSFELDEGTKKENLRYAASQYGARHNKKFSIRKIGESTRCWRLR